MNFEYVKIKTGDSGEELPALRETFGDFCFLTATAATTGYCGGDAGHGGVTAIRFSLEGGSAAIIPLKGNGFEYVVRGDDELDALIAALKV